MYPALTIKEWKEEFCIPYGCRWHLRGDWDKPRCMHCGEEIPENLEEAKKRSKGNELLGRTCK